MEKRIACNGNLINKIVLQNFSGALYIKSTKFFVTPFYRYYCLSPVHLTWNKIFLYFTSFDLHGSFLKKIKMNLTKLQPCVEYILRFILNKAVVLFNTFYKFFENDPWRPKLVKKGLYRYIPYFILD